MYKVKLNTFEGPFDLLVYLIENAQMSIYDIKVSEITTQYLDYIKEMKEQNISLTQDFMVLAATLIEIKSKMILPRADKLQGDYYEEDPRLELTKRLIEYKEFKRLGEVLRQREERGFNIIAKPQEDISQYLENPDEILSLNLKDFANAFNLFILKKKRIEEVKKHYTKIERERASMESRISLILSKLRNRIKSVFSFRELIPPGGDRYDVVVSFVSVLEMIKAKAINAKQSMNYGDIEISPGENIDKDSLLEKYRENPKALKEEIKNVK